MRMEPATHLYKNEVMWPNKHESCKPRTGQAHGRKVSNPESWQCQVQDSNRQLLKLRYERVVTIRSKIRTDHKYLAPAAGGD
jgi:hypothetical protein